MDVVVNVVVEAIVVLAVEEAVVVGATLVVDASVTAAAVDGGASTEDSALHETARPTRMIARLAVKSRSHFSIHPKLRVRSLSVNARLGPTLYPATRRCRPDEPRPDATEHSVGFL